MKTYSARAEDVSRDWLLVDAEGQTLGRVASAIANAIEDAVGVRLVELPLTPERVLAALDAARSTRAT